MGWVKQPFLLQEASRQQLRKRTHPPASLPQQLLHSVAHVTLIATPSRVRTQRNHSRISLHEGRFCICGAGFPAEDCGLAKQARGGGPTLATAGNKQL
uniref:Uncharacterized protein n=1 Tax=Physcomitrium patens TaxID=3218 RepID=A0A2K1KUS8_PHYPA|nr:hypothetical protein PHYPA_004494 [Physcomitrium patens]